MKHTYDGFEINLNDPIVLGRDLKLMRLFANVTLVVAAEYMGIKSRKTIENWEAGRSSPNIQQFMLLSRYYGLNAGLIVEKCMNRLLSGPHEEYQKIDIEACRL